jgi:sensor histidine kinase YesM
VIRRLREWIFKNPSFWRLNLIVWSGFSLLSLVSQFTYYPLPPIALLMVPAQVLVAMCFSGLLRFVYRQFVIDGAFRWRMATGVILLSLVAALFHSSIVQWIQDDTRWMTSEYSPWVSWLLRTKLLWFTYIGWSLGYFGVRAEFEVRLQSENAARAREEARNIELQMLRSQLDPHFLFNSLNGISAEIPVHPGPAVEMVDELAGYLRYSLDHRHQVLAPLSEELDSMEAYLRIEKVRFGRRLQTRTESDPSARRRQVPCFLMQPLVENAVKHGLTDSEQPLEIIIEARNPHDALHLKVTNTGRLAKVRPESVGLSTLRRRLELHYPSRHSFNIRQEGNYVCAEIILKGDPCSGS